MLGFLKRKSPPKVFTVVSVANHMALFGGLAGYYLTLEDEDGLKWEVEVSTLDVPRPMVGMKLIHCKYRDYGQTKYGYKVQMGDAVYTYKVR